MKLTAEQQERFFRQLNLPELGSAGQEKLATSSVLVIGVGGLGHAAALALAGAGVGRLGLIDAGEVAPSNLPRQLSYGEADVGAEKVAVLKKLLLQKNSQIEIDTYNYFLTEQNGSLLKEYSFTIDGTDNFAAKYLINDLARLYQKPFVHGGALRWQGQLYTYLPGRHCLRCFLPEIPQAEDDIHSAGAGIVNSLPSIVGFLQATEALKYLTGAGELLSENFLTIDLLTMKFKKIPISHLSHGECCGVKNG